jgi:hypothetical protein
MRDMGYSRRQDYKEKWAAARLKQAGSALRSRLMAIKRFGINRLFGRGEEAKQAAPEVEDKAPAAPDSTA